ncbi:hypothetical protein, conserved [Eimeria necatrix]|uniref:Ubiquitin-like domain-containing protein n=1 Tax=Eimeria necatrix TaxID=51315 RepID=U6MTY7_9EIME|nr:hypothetical protein, conserved [Eimeria necatrix]CDJ67481.1 hypothetical protein, conserved [Eimeria necatrix]
MAGEKVRVKWVVNCTGEPATFTESLLDANSTIREVKDNVFAGEISRGLSVRVIFLGRELADSDSLASHLRVPARAAAAGSCATTASADAQNSAAVTLHAVISNRPPHSRGSGVSGCTNAGGGPTEEGDWSVIVLGVTVFVILCVCWYHRLAFPADFTPFSSLLLVLFTGFYAFTVRGVVVRVFKVAYGCLRRPWSGAAQSARPDASALSFQEVPPRPLT